MFSFDKYKQIDPRLKNLNEKEIQQVLGMLSDLADFALELYLEEKGVSKNPVGVYRRDISNVQE